MGSKRPTAWSFRLNSYMQRWTPSANSSRSCGSSMVSTAKAHETFATSKRSTTSYGHGIGVWHWDALGLHSKPYDISILHTQGPQFDQPNSLGLSESGEPASLAPLKKRLACAQIHVYLPSCTKTTFYF